VNDGFIDLRQNKAHFVDDSFWPSFTDIMTVVVMIFLITSSILIVKNWELVNELKERITAEQLISQRLKETIAIHQQTTLELKDSLNKRQEITQKLQSSIEAERRTAATIKQTSAEKATLEEVLTHTQSELSLLRLQLMQAKESAIERDNLIAEQDRHLLEMQVEKNKLQKNLQSTADNLALVKSQLLESNNAKTALYDQLENTSLQLARKEQDLKKQIATSKQQLTQTNSIKNTLQNKLEDAAILLVRKERDLLNQKTTLSNTKKELAQLNLLNKTYLDEISEHEKLVILTQQQHALLSNEYDDLEIKYNKLIKPSRSAIGKYVVEVRYEKISEKAKIQFRQTGQKSFQSISHGAMHKKLKQLKQEYKQNLYVKIIIPDNSGLSYNEAWTFMTRILEKYDYYYQNKPRSAKETNSPSPITR